VWAFPLAHARELVEFGVQGAGSSFRTPGTEGKGRAYLADDRRRRSADETSPSAAAAGEEPGREPLRIGEVSLFPKNYQERALPIGLSRGPRQRNGGSRGRLEWVVIRWQWHAGEPLSISAVVAFWPGFFFSFFLFLVGLSEFTIILDQIVCV
jgi:hypothetical protein